MKILTTVKRVTDPDMKVKIKPDGSGIQTEGVDYKMNSFDEYGVEEAVAIKEEHGGEIDVQSKAKHGTTFTISLPTEMHRQPAETHSPF